MSTIVTRAGKGSALTHNEVDANFNNLNNDKIEAAQSVTLTNKTLSTGTAITAGTINNATIGASTPSSGAFTTLSASSTVSGTGFSTYLASPPAIGGTAAAAGSFTTLSATGVTTVQAGTVSAPAITTSGDTNTGIFFPAADTIAFTEGGVESGRFTSTGALQLNANLTFSGTGNRITGDFSNATQASRVLFQTSTANTATAVGLIPNGTGTTSNINLFSSSDPTNASFAQLRVENVQDVRLSSGITGTGTYLPMTFYTGGSERMRLDTSGNVGIGTSSPGYTASNRTVLQVNGSTQSLISLAYGGTNAWYAYADSSNTILLSEGARNLTIGTVGAAPQIFTTNNTERARFNASAPILCLSGGNTSATGTGIAFPATQSASSDANTLDDYEEGSFTPSIIGSSTAGTATYSTRTGRYTKIGRLVHVEIWLEYSGGNGTGALRISNLPFTSSSALTLPALSIGYFSNITLGANAIATAYVRDNETQITFEQYPAGGGTASNVSYDGAGSIVIAGCYST